MWPPAAPLPSCPSASLPHATVVPGAAAAARPLPSAPAVAATSAITAIAHAKARRRFVTCTENPPFPVALIDTFCV
jgi:hypothetical protein